jgi:hypothetical protein
MRILKDFRNPANAPPGHSPVHRAVVQDECLPQLAKVSIRPEIGVGVLEPTSSRRRGLGFANGNGRIPQGEPPSANTQFYISESDRRQKSWIGWSSAGLSPPVVDEVLSLYSLSFSIYRFCNAVYTYSGLTPFPISFISPMQLSLVRYS